jgi:UDP-N-acetylmuramyl pentapeptide synthase
VPLVGRHNALNAACALAVATALGVDLEAAARGIATATPAAQRSEVRTIGGRHVLVDCYNANPASMKAALATLAELAASQGGGARAVAVLGDMLELGHTEDEEHTTVGKLVAANKIEHLVTVGERAKLAAAAARAAGVGHVESFGSDEVSRAAETAVAWSRPGDWVLFKASRGMKLERVIVGMETLVR